MKRKKMKELMTFVPGVNPTRAQNQLGVQEITYYDQASFEQDFNYRDTVLENEFNYWSGENEPLSEDDIVLSNSLQLVTMVGKSNVGKVLTINFTKIELNNELIDNRYFLYLFNSSRDVRRQKERELQGSGPVLKIPLRALGEIIVPLVSMEEQKKIGAIYVETIKLQNKLNEYSNLLEQFTNAVLEENLKEE